MKEFIINENDAGQRLDKFVYKVTTNFSGPLLYKHLRKNSIKVNGKKQEISYRLRIGDTVKLYINDEFFPDKEKPAYLSLKKDCVPNIIYEDRNILALDKAPGLIVHEDETEKTHTLINYALNYLTMTGQYDPNHTDSFTPALCNRIDKNTGGIVLVAKNAAAGRALYEIIKTRQLEKYYLTLVQGKMPKPKDVLTAYLVKDSNNNRVQIYDTPVKNGKTIKTGYRVLKENQHCSLLEVELFTGRTHQIRAHLAHIGHPILGDNKYGKAEQNRLHPFHYQALYAYKLVFKIQSQENPLYYLNQKSISVSDVYFKNYI